MARRRLSDAEREERRRRDRERLEEATRSLLTSEGWQRWIEVRRNNGLARYSLHNQLLIAHEAVSRGISPLYVAGFRWWAEHGYRVRRGEKAIRILAPIRRRRRDPEAEEDGYVVVGFRGVPVFDVSQVEATPDAMSLEPPPTAPIDGESHAEHLPSVERRLARIGCVVRYEEIERDGVEGFYAPKRGEVVIESRLPGNARLRTLLHEAAHALVDRELLDEEERLPYATEEVVVETIGYLVASAVGLDTQGEAVRYVASWSREEAREIARLAELIDTGARRLEDALEVGASAEGHALSRAA
jgi:antirestriction protein ArdC